MSSSYICSIPSSEVFPINPGRFAPQPPDRVVSQMLENHSLFTFEEKEDSHDRSHATITRPTR